MCSVHRSQYCRCHLMYTCRCPCAFTHVPCPSFSSSWRWCCCCERCCCSRQVTHCCAQGSTVHHDVGCIYFLRVVFDHIFTDAWQAETRAAACSVSYPIQPLVWRPGSAAAHTAATAAAPLCGEGHAATGGKFHSSFELVVRLLLLQIHLAPAPQEAQGGSGQAQQQGAAYNCHSHLKATGGSPPGSSVQGTCTANQQQQRRQGKDKS